MVVLENLPGHLSQSPSGDSGHTDWAAERNGVAAYLACYPSLTDFSFVTRADQLIGLQWHGPDELSVRVMLGQAETYQEESADISRRSHEWCGLALAYPAVGGSSLPAHPFLLWWAILYTLSQLSRYEPKAWAARTAIASSSDASAIEHLLHRATVTLPELIHRTIMEAAG